MPIPHKGTSATDKGRLLLTYVAEGQSLAFYQGSPDDCLTETWDLLDFRGADLVGAELSGENLMLAWLSGANLRGANLMRADLRGSVLGQAIFAGGDLSGASLSAANLRGADLRGCRLVGAHLSHADLSEAVLADADLSGATLSDANLRGADLRGCRLVGADLRYTDLRDAVVEGATMVDVDLAGAYLDGVNLSQSDLAGASLVGARFDSKTRWPNRFDHIRSGAVGASAVLDGLDLREVPLHGLNLRRVSARNANLRGCSLRGSDLTGAILEGTDLEGANMKGAILVDANLSRSSLAGAELSGAKITWQTATNSGWSMEEVQSLIRRGVVVLSFEAGWKNDLGLTLTFDTRLHRFDATAFDALIARVLGPDTDVTIEERSNIGGDGPAFIRINGANPDDLAAVAEAFYSGIWRVDEPVADERAPERADRPGLATLLRQRLDTLLGALVSLAVNLPAVAAMLTDKAADHALARTAAARRIEDLNNRVGQECEARRALEALIAGLFAPGTLHVWVGSHLGSALANALPGPTATHEEIVAGLVVVLERRGRVDRTLFEALEERAPERAELIWGVAAKWGVARG